MSILVTNSMIDLKIKSLEKFLPKTKDINTF